MLGVAISAMVLTGTLIVGDSVDYSLEKTAELRLGNISYTFSGVDRYFRAALAYEIQGDLKVPVSAILQLKGIASSQGGDMKLNNVDVHGIDPDFLKIIPGNNLKDLPGKNETFISQNLADRLQLKVDDSFLLRVEKVSLMPKNAPFISDDEDHISMRLKIAKILGQEDLGRFNLKTSQTAPYNVFVTLDFLNDKMETAGKANRLLISDDPGMNEQSIKSAIENKWNLEDSGIKLGKVNSLQEWAIESDRVFIDSVIIEAVKQFEPEPSLILTYMANSIVKGDKSTPYSFVSAGPFSVDNTQLGPSEILVNDWLAEDIDAEEGDSIKLTYFIIGPLRKLEEQSQWFTVKKIVPMTGFFGDQKLMPTLPGLSDAGSCRNWETGIPIDLERIRDKDEDYWNNWKGTPKAYINYSVGKSLWENRFGNCTAIRLDAELFDDDDIKRGIRNYLIPENLGFRIRSVKSEGLVAAHGGVDFAELFFGMSFFLLLAALTLLALLFNIHLENRMQQIGTLKSIGYPDHLVRKLVLYEGLIVGIVGVVLGSLLAILYNKLIFHALNTVWSEIVRTSVLTEDIRLKTLIAGMIISFFLTYLTIFYNVYKKLKVRPAKLQKGLRSSQSRFSWKWLQWIARISGVAALALLINELALGESLNAGIFFMAGGLMLLTLILFYAGFLYTEKEAGYDHLSFSDLAIRNLQRNRARSVRIVILFALGTFVIVSTGLNRKDLYSDAINKNSGTGGYVFYGETTMPVLLDLNDPDIQTEYGLEIPAEFVQMRKSEGDDASCLNLNRIAQPRLLGIPSEDLLGRFSFIKTTKEFDTANDWISLKRELPGGVVPAIADQTVIQWGLGKKVGDTLIYKNESGDEMYVKLIGGLANSIFQGNILIDEGLFLRHFPTNSGIHVFLVESNEKDRTLLEDELKRSFRNAGLELVYTADRLAEFNTVENTYLSIFLLLGGLGMILGTIGLGLSLIRNIIDRQQELAILRAIGFKKKAVLNMLTREHVILLGTGTIIGAISAFVATIPSVFSAFIEASWQTAALIIVLIILNGLIWIYLIGKSSLHKNLVASLRSE